MSSGRGGTGEVGTSRGGTGEPRVVLYGKPGCHLCDVARETVVRVCDELGEQWVEVDVTGSPDLMARYGEELPVTFVDGRQHDFWRVDPVRLRRALGHDG